MPARHPSFLLLVAAIGLVAAGCSREPATQSPESVFGKGPRFPSDEGVVTEIDFERVVLEGPRGYKISPEVQSFSTYNGKVIPLVHHKGRYIQLRLDNERRLVIWISVIGQVIPQPAGPRVTYVGVFEKVDDKRRAVFKDGTVLKLGDEVTAPEAGQRVGVRIDSARREVVTLGPA